jgi:hypothetical protein
MDTDKGLFVGKGSPTYESAPERHRMGRHSLGQADSPKNSASPPASKLLPETDA